MTSEDDYVALRRAIYALNKECLALTGQAEKLNDNAAQALHQARRILFEAWTHMSRPSEIEEDD